MYYSLTTLLSLSLICLNVYGSKHICSHGSKKSSQNIPSDYLETFESKYGKRILQSSQNIKPFRFTFDTSQLYNKTNGEGMTDDKRKYITKIMQAAQVFLRNFIQVVPRQTPVISSYGWESCGVEYPPQLYKNGTGIPNSDMHVLVSYQNDASSSTVAFASFVQSIGGIYSQCPTAVTISDQYCQDPSFQPSEWDRLNTGVNSYCFESTSVKNNEQIDLSYAQRCNIIKCSEDFSTITVYLWKQESITCTIPGQVIDLSKVTKTTIGNFTCPIDFQMFCSFPSSCPKQCSQNGICTNGYCMCLDGYAGEDCSIICASPNVYDGTKCVTKCTGSNYKNPDNTCKPKCPQGYYKESSSNTCILCHTYCSNCTGPLSTQCSSCNLGYLLKGNTCDSYPCDPTCGTCFGLGSNQCTSCVSGYALSGSTCLPACDPSCKSCSSANNANSCTDCFDGFFLNSNKQCIQCQMPCKNCAKSATQCTSCQNNTDYIFDSIKQTCNLVCNNTCSSCFAPNDSTKCNSCIDGYYIDGTTCKQCKSPCSKCTQSPTKCIGCVANYQINNQNECIPQCDQSCNTCSKPQDKNSCITCNKGYTMVNSLCQQCTNPCSECQTSQTKCTKCAPSHILKENVCQPTCDDSCLTCSKFIDPKSCTSCNSGFYLSVNNKEVQGSCKQCSSFCQICKDGQSCQKCISGYLLQDNGSCSPICDASCLTCSKPNDRNSCLSCSAPLIFKNSQCQQCGEGFYFDNGSCSNCSNNCKSCSNKLKCEICMDGYILDITFNCIKSNTCHLTCQNCIGDSYYQCTFCPSNRLLVKIDESLSYGICQCPEDTTDYNESECEQSKTQKNIKQTIIGSFAGSAFTSILISVGLQNPLIALSYFQLSQGISYLNLVNAKQSVGFDEVLRVISFSNFDFQQFKSPSKSINNKRILPDQHSIDLVNDNQLNQNPKIALNNKNYNFLQNSQPILWIQGFAWLISFSTYLINKYVQIQSSFIKNIQKYTVISLPLITFAVCSQEMWLCIFYQFILQSNGLSDAGQFVCSLFGFFYMIAVLCYLFYQLEYKKCLNTRQFIKSLQTIDVNSTQNLQITSDTNLEDQKKFYFLNQYVKQDSFATRNIIQIAVLLKMIISIAASCIYQNAYAQIILFILSYFAFCVYISVFRPLKQVKCNVILFLIYFIITVLSIIYAASISFQNDTQSSQTLSLVMLSIIIATYVVFLAFWALILLHLIYKQLKKCIYKDFQFASQDQPKILPQNQIPQLKDEQATQLHMIDNTQTQFGVKSGQFSQNQIQSDKRINGFNSVKVL
ncbi:hypothetical protein ABPG73_017057 [Tetrahymena malaccensis]